MKYLFTILVFVFNVVPFCVAHPPSIKSMLNTLDSVIENKPQYAKVKEERIRNYQRLLALAKDDDSRYYFHGRLFDEYRYYNSDSAFCYAQQKMQIAVRLNDKDRINDVNLNLADIYSLGGMYEEALTSLDKVRGSEVQPYLKPYYFHLYRNIYNQMADFSLRKQDQEHYKHVCRQYSDSLLNIKDASSVEYVLVRAEELIDNGAYDKALSMLLDKKNSLEHDDHNQAFFDYSLAQIYKQKGDDENAIRYLIQSSVSDLKSAIKDYVSLRELAQLLYKIGDIDRAYSYLKCSMDDAQSANARLRTVEISQIFPIIDYAYTHKKEQQEKQMMIGFIGISFLSFILFVILFILYKQMKHVAEARRGLRKANGELNKLNQALLKVNNELNESNGQLKQMNEILSETNVIKEEYIGRYMDQCSAYIEKIESYRKTLHKLVNSRNMDKLVELIKSTTLIEKELKEFYHNFDSTFLKLFPDFVDDFNALLNEPERIYPKNADELNTELRIYALIRLGITDSVKIAHFLRYSVTTIYNYRTRIRNKAVGERAEFENKVMQIGSVEK